MFSGCWILLTLRDFPILHMERKGLAVTTFPLKQRRCNRNQTVTVSPLWFSCPLLSTAQLLNPAGIRLLLNTNAVISLYPHVQLPISHRQDSLQRVNIVHRTLEHIYCSKRLWSEQGSTTMKAQFHITIFGQMLNHSMVYCKHQIKIWKLGYRTLKICLS